MAGKLGVAIALAVAIVAVPQVGFSIQPETRPTTQTSPSTATSQTSDIDLRDYCTVLLALKLQDHLGVTDDQRANLAEMKIKLKAYLDNAAGNIHGVRVTPGLVAARGETALGMIGKMVRAELTPAQRAKLVEMFDAKTLEPIKVGAEVTTANGLRGSTVISNIQLAYTHYGENQTPVASRLPSSQPTTSSTTSQSTSPVPGSPRSRRASEHVDVAGAITGLQSDAAAKQVLAASQLERAVPDETNRPKVLQLLRPAVKDTGDEHWSAFVRAYCVWADAAEIETLKEALKAADNNKRSFQKEEASAAICAALVNLDPQTAVDGINSRIANSTFRAFLIGDLQRLSKRDGPNQARLLDIHNQVMKSGGEGKIVLNP